MKTSTKFLILVWVGIVLIILGALLKRTIRIENKIDDLRILNELRTPIELNKRAVEITPELYRIVQCESQWKENAVGGGGLAYGYAQFWRETFEWLAELSGEEGLDYYNPTDQLWLLDWSLKNGRGYLWSCARLLGLAN